MNNANQINVGLDIINTLNKHFGIRVPVFLDNAESVINLLDIDAQLIALFVKDIDGLEVSTKEKESEAVAN